MIHKSIGNMNRIKYTDNLFTVVQELLDVTKAYFNTRLGPDGGLEFEIPIGSKTGSGWLYESEGLLFLKTRYDEIDEIDPNNAVEDVARVAWRWYLAYKNRDTYNYMSSDWTPTWEKIGLIKKETTTRYVEA